MQCRDSIWCHALVIGVIFQRYAEGEALFGTAWLEKKTQNIIIIKIKKKKICSKTACGKMSSGEYKEGWIYYCVVFAFENLI